ncbi:MAG: hypothetical protein IMW99_04040 [Firmicutes bacterium]|nr:hypothetical protein [Bacillota bacterium]
MCQEMAHRGPDGRGVHQEPGLGLGFQRLAIIGREDGQQPLGNEDGSLYLVCNGEIYNHLELRRQLTRQGHVFRTHSDVEIILHLYEEEGAGCLDRLRGMFAFALWDRRRRSLLLARDRLGIKPLYYMEIRPGRTGRLSRPGPETPAPAGLAFASEIKALLSLPEVQAVPDLRALHAYLTFRYGLGGRCVLRFQRHTRKRRSAWDHPGSAPASPAVADFFAGLRPCRGAAGRVLRVGPGPGRG